MDIKSKNKNYQEFANVIKENSFKKKVNIGIFIEMILDKIRNIRVNNRVIALSICISLIPVLMGIVTSHRFTNRKEIINNIVVQAQLRAVNDRVDQINYYLKDSDGTFREEAVKAEVESLKENNLKKFEKAKIDLELYKINNNIKDSNEESNDKEYNKLKMNIENADNDYKKSQEEYEKSAVKSLNDKVEDIRFSLKDCNNNIEYYIESSSGNIITNIYGESINEILIDTYKHKDYIAYLGVSGNTAQQVNISESMKPLCNLVSIANVTKKIIRISNNLVPGDDIYDLINNAYNSNIAFLLSSILILIDILIILVMVFVRKLDIRYNQNYVTNKYNRVFFEVKSLIFMAMNLWLYYVYLDNCRKEIYFLKIVIEVVGCSLVMYLCISSIYDYIVHFKNKTLKNNSLFIKLYKKVHDNEKDEIKYKKIILTKTCMVFVSYLILVCYTCGIVGYNCCPWGLDDIIYGSGNTIVFVMMSLIATVIIFGLIFINIIDSYSIKNATDKILEGNYEEKLMVYGNGLHKSIANNISNIKEGFNDAVSNAVKSERMKSELITNVSHDLKTPLTSIINYVDLLSKDNVSEENKNQYLDILSNRSLRLKHLIEDLFEASKASSGSLVYNFETLDPVALLRQSLGEFEDKITSSGLTIIKNLPDNKLRITADGKRTFRVIQNLISNITKYSMKNSRVYIDVVEKEKYILMVFKNISEYQMNFSEEDIMERFKRGDDSRTTEGSGLGLAIAKSLVEGQGGLFEIKIDGDLFKAEVRLKKDIQN